MAYYTVIYQLEAQFEALDLAEATKRGRWLASIIQVTVDREAFDNLPFAASYEPSLTPVSVQAQAVVEAQGQ